MKLDAKNDPTIRDFENWVKDKLHGMRTEQPSTTQVSETGSNYYANYQQSRTARYPAKVLAELLETGEINREQYERLRRESIDRDEPPALRAGERYGFVVFTGRFKVLDYHKANGQQMATADGEEEARTIVRALNTAEQHATLVEQRDQLVKIISMTTCYGCHNRIGWNETPTKYGDWTKCSSCRAARELISTIEREGV